MRSLEEDHSVVSLAVFHTLGGCGFPLELELDLQMPATSASLFLPL